MSRHTPNLALAAPLGLALWALLALASAPAWAIWETDWDDGASDADLRLFTRLGTTRQHNPAPRLLYPNTADTQTLSLARALSVWHIDDWLTLDVNAFGALTSTTAQGGVSAQQTESAQAIQDQPWRWGRLDWRWSDAPSASSVLGIDWLNAQLKSPLARVTVGRQPVNLATTYFFTPNDLFTPFAAQTFFRQFRAGIDAARIDWALGDFTGLTTLAALGYRSTHGAARPALGASAAVARAYTAWETLEAGLLGGVQSDDALLGADVQGEVWEGAVGYRAAGHVRWDMRDTSESLIIEAAAALDHRLDSGLQLQAEVFHHGAGARDPDGYLARLIDLQRTRGYLGRLYAAFGASDTITPLLQASSALLVNATDGSVFASAYGVYSLSDEAELGVVVALPLGASATAEGLPRSEFGLAPWSLNAELRATF